MTEVEKAIQWFEARNKATTMPGARKMAEMAIAALRAQQEAEQQAPCSRCGYGGKYLDAPPCTICPAHPKGAENNTTPSTTADRIRLMSDAKRALHQIIVVQGITGLLTGSNSQRRRNNNEKTIF